MKSEFINCKNCTDDCRCKGKDITPICISFKPAKTTNADLIRAMTDEELVFFLWWFAAESGKTKDQWLDWLKQEAQCTSG